jgi:outer membrane murein-binding lipoprotein Lpp
LHIQEELNSLRECFAKLKIERDNLLFEIDGCTSREREWRKTVEKMSDEVSKMEAQIANREREQSNQVRVIESKNLQMTSEVKYTKEECDRMKEKVRAMEQHAMA